ncbi:hypothetical protein [Nocardioides piscis]|uniref:Uncharacterized protein n=1 Tax=Nocardioides piscis TaxID=2714938 RepID=A0A6G7YJ13_9ACTN|nr:hypothetical protein [Nocardioides piscis]QIK76734.1 hypothetical protein G7071_16185 [Nocardioides piscis]
MMGYAVRVLLASILAGLICVGIVSRLAMLLLARLNPMADGVVSDDGFVMGQFTVSGSLNLFLLGGTLIAVVGALTYFVVRPLLFGPVWFQWFSLSLPPGVVAGAVAVHTGGVDFQLLEPLWLAVSLFVAVPALFGPMVHALMLRTGRRAPGSRAVAAHPGVAWVVRAGFCALVLYAVVDLVNDVRVLA